MVETDPLSDNGPDTDVSAATTAVADAVVRYGDVDVADLVDHTAATVVAAAAAEFTVRALPAPNGTSCTNFDFVNHFTLSSSSSLLLRKLTFYIFFKLFHASHSVSPYYFFI